MSKRHQDPGRRWHRDPQRCRETGLTYKKDDVYVDTQQFNSSNYEKVVKADGTITNVYTLEFESSGGDFDEVQFSLASGTFSLKGLTIYLKSQN